MRGLITITMVAAIIIAGCNSKNAVKQKIDKPRPEACSKPSTFRIDPKKDTLLKVPGGTSIHIPANAIADKSGKPVNDSVRIDYSEYVNPAGIILSGIPMLYDSAGDMNVFRSAGMFEIYAKGSEDESFTIAPGKKVDVNMASPVEDKNGAYNFYNFDTASGRWNYLATVPASPVPAKETRDTVPGKAEYVTAPATAKINVNSEFVFDFKVDYSAFPELKGQNNVMWKYSNNPDYVNPEQQQWIFDETWEQVKLVKDSEMNGAYLLMLKNRKKEFTTSVKAVLSGTNSPVDVSTQAEKMNIRSKEMQDKADMEERVNKAMRSFSISGFGIYNWDCIHRFIEPVITSVNYLADGKEIADGGNLYQVFQGLNIVIRIKDEKQNTIVPQENFVVLAILPDGEIAYSRDISRLRGLSDPKTGTSLNLTKTGRKLTSEKDLLAYIPN